MQEGFRRSGSETPGRKAWGLWGFLLHWRSVNSQSLGSGLELGLGPEAPREGTPAPLRPKAGPAKRKTSAMELKASGIAAWKLQLVGPPRPAGAHHHTDGQAWQENRCKNLALGPMLHDSHGHVMITSMM